MLATEWDQSYYLDITMTFGSRASSGHMQCVAVAIVAILQAKGVVAHMYLDDLIVVADGHAERQSSMSLCVRYLKSSVSLRQLKILNPHPKRSDGWVSL